MFAFRATVSWMCDALGVSQGGFHAWLTRPRCDRAKWDEEVGKLVHASFLRSDHSFDADGSMQKWIANFIYVWTAEGWFYASVVLDLFSRRAVGWSPLGNMLRIRLSGNG